MPTGNYNQPDLMVSNSNPLPFHSVQFKAERMLERNSLAAEATADAVTTTTGDQAKRIKLETLDDETTTSSSSTSTSSSTTPAYYKQHPQPLRRKSVVSVN